jgi:hypothetical protein
MPSPFVCIDVVDERFFVRKSKKTGKWSRSDVHQRERGSRKENLIGKFVVSRSEELVMVWLSSEFKLSLGLEDWKAIHFCGFVVVFSIVNDNKKPL